MNCVCSLIRRSFEESSNGSFIKDVSESLRLRRRVSTVKMQKNLSSVFYDCLGWAGWSQ
jgi:hypothetical protein